MTGRHFTLIALLAIAMPGALLDFGASAQTPPPVVYYVSMRGLQTEATPTFVVVVRQQTAERATLVAGCDGRNYYATAGDAAAVASARANGELVQLHRGRQGDPAASAAIRCIIDASGT